jgi:hypothetical protein
MLASIEKRVRMWKDVLPFYSDAVYGAGKEVESRNAEAVLNAVILASYDAPQKHLRDVTRLAFDNAWALQSKTGPAAGAWVWQNFDYTPWESKESEYYWAAMFAEVVAQAPNNYRTDPGIIGNLAALRVYLRGQYETQPLLNKIVVLWASAHFPGLLTSQPNARPSSLKSMAASIRTAAGASPTSAPGSGATRPRLKRAPTAMPPRSPSSPSKKTTSTARTCSVAIHGSCPIRTRPQAPGRPGRSTRTAIRNRTSASS